MQGKFKSVKLTAHDHYISIDWETAEEKGSYEFEKGGTGWKAYSSIKDDDLTFLQELIQACLLLIDVES